MHGQTRSPPLLPIAGPKFQPGPKGPCRRCVSSEERDRPFGQDERNVSLQAYNQALLLMLARRGLLRNINPHLVIANFHRKRPDVVRPLIERPSGGQIEPGVMPMTRENAVFHAPPTQRESHVGTAIVD